MLRQSKEEIEYLYNRYTMSDCALILDSSHQAVSRLLSKYNIPARKRGAKPPAEVMGDFIDKIDDFYKTVPGGLRQDFINQLKSLVRRCDDTNKSS